MSSFEHFGHEHPLIFNKEKNIEEEINRDHFCHICSLPILLSSFYSCSVTDCKYFLHEPCALLPRRIDHPWDFCKCLDLVKHGGNCRCTRCHQLCKNLHYCDWLNPLHPMCGAPMEIKSKHKSHPLHPLVAVGRETLVGCDACGQEQKGCFFSCLPCNFWIHVDCALLPRSVKCTKHMHPLILSYSFEGYDTYCMICDEEIFASGAYLCGDCRGYAHLSCVADNMEDLGTVLSADAEKWIKHYSNRHEMLLVGEGDFSFAACLARAFGNASNIVATSLDSKEELALKHPTAAANLEALENRGGTIIHGVDASTMCEHPRLKNRLFHRIVFNFPHAGFAYKKCDTLQIQLHQDVVRGFLRSAERMLEIRENGEVHVTHKTAHPFSAWEIEKLGKQAGLEFIEAATFCLWDYPGYTNKRGGSGHHIFRSNDTFPVGQSCTDKFGH